MPLQILFLFIFSNENNIFLFGIFTNKYLFFLKLIYKNKNNLVHLEWKNTYSSIRICKKKRIIFIRQSRATALLFNRAISQLNSLRYSDFLDNSNSQSKRHSFWLTMTPYHWQNRKTDFHDKILNSDFLAPTHDYCGATTVMPTQYVFFLPKQLYWKRRNWFPKWFWDLNKCHCNDKISPLEFFLTP